MARGTRSSPAVGARAVRLVREQEGAHAWQWTAIPSPPPHPPPHYTTTLGSPTLRCINTSYTERPVTDATAFG